MQNEITLLRQKYTIIDVLDNIAIPDCFVKRNKQDSFTGSGEAKLYVGSRQKIEQQSFFSDGNERMKGFVLKRDLLDYLQEAKFEYENQEQNYRKDISNYWVENKQNIENVEDIIPFYFNESSAGGNRRYYITSCRGDIFYKQFREIVLPEITYLSILKVEDINGETLYYFRPYLNYFYDSRHHSFIIAEKEKIIEDDSEIEINEKKEIKLARKGQGKYRDGVIDIFGECIMTRVNDERILIASHIKPWAVCDTHEEQIDKYNGLLLTPTYDRLFDQGFITFSNDGVISVSPYLSPLNTKKLKLIPNKKYNIPFHRKRLNYLKYHREKVYKGL